MPSRTGADHRAGVIVYRNREAFWLGTFAVSAGVVLHVPMFIDAGDMDYHMTGMPVSVGMGVGMALIVAGLLVAAYGLIPVDRAPRRAIGGLSRHDDRLRSLGLAG